MFFYLSLGSNINAEQSSASMLRELCGRFKSLALYPFCWTAPEAIVSEQDFSNALVILHTPLSAAELKAILVGIESRMGRDRADPQRSVKSRAADIDILFESELFEPDLFQQAAESYVAHCLSLTGPFVDLTEYGLAATQGPSSVYLDALTSEVVIVDDKFERFKDGLKTSFSSQ